MKFLGFVLVVYLILLAALFFAQRSLLYFPVGSKPSDVRRYLTLQVANENIIISQREHDGEQALIYFGGNGEDVAFSLDEYAQHFPQHAIYMLHYRGYGGSSGKPSEADLKSDALALFDLVRKKHSKITLVGRSLGSGIALATAQQRAAERLLLVTPYDSIVRLAQSNFPYVPVSWLLLDRYESWKIAPQIKVPTTILMAERDEVIPRQHTIALFESFAPGVAQLRLVKGEGHNTISQAAEFFPLLQAQ